jgi:hypothetical protein
MATLATALLSVCLVAWSIHHSGARDALLEKSRTWIAEARKTEQMLLDENRKEITRAEHINGQSWRRKMQAEVHVESNAHNLEHKMLSVLAVANNLKKKMLALAAEPTLPHLEAAKLAATSGNPTLPQLEAAKLAATSGQPTLPHLEAAKLAATSGQPTLPKLEAAKLAATSGQASHLGAINYVNSRPQVHARKRALSISAIRTAAASLAKFAVDDAALKQAKVKVTAALGPFIEDEAGLGLLVEDEAELKQAKTRLDQDFTSIASFSPSLARRLRLANGLPSKTLRTTQALKMSTSFRNDLEPRVDTRAEKQAEKQADWEAVNLGLMSPQERAKRSCRPPRIWIEASQSCIFDNRNDQPPLRCGRMTEEKRKSTPACVLEERKYAQDLQKYVQAVHNKKVEAQRNEYTRPGYEYKGMTAKAAQAVFSIKPHQYPLADKYARPVGDMYLQRNFDRDGERGPKGIVKVMRDREVPVGTEPPSHAPFFFAPSDSKAYDLATGGNPYMAGYVNPYVKEAPRSMGGKNPMNPAVTGRPPYTTKYDASGHSYKVGRPFRGGDPLDVSRGLLGDHLVNPFKLQNDPFL